MKVTITDLRNENVFFCSDSLSHYYQINLANVFAPKGDRSYCISTERNFIEPSDKTLDFSSDKVMTTIFPCCDSMLVLLLAKRNVLDEKVVLLLSFIGGEVILDWYDLKKCPKDIQKSLSQRFKKLTRSEHGMNVVNDSIISYESHRKGNASPTEELKTYLSNLGWADIGMKQVDGIKALSSQHKRKMAFSNERTTLVLRDAEGQPGYNSREIPNFIEVSKDSRKLVYCLLVELLLFMFFLLLLLIAYIHATLLKGFCLNQPATLTPLPKTSMSKTGRTTADS